MTARLESLGGTALGEQAGQKWAEGRFHGPYLRDSLLDVGVLVETLETATFWSNLPRLYADVSAALTDALDGDSPLVLCHISHVYETGASLYFTVAAGERDDVLAQWATAKRAASDAIIAAGATITHHHAVGRDHLPWLAEEIGPVGVEMLRAVKERLDPQGAASCHPEPLRSRRSLRSRCGTRDSSFRFLVNPGSGSGTAPAAAVPVARLLREAGARGGADLQPGPCRLCGGRARGRRPWRRAGRGRR